MKGSLRGLKNSPLFPVYSVFPVFPRRAGSISMVRSKNQLGKFKRPEELVWGPASLLRAICEHTVGDLSSVNSRHLYLLQKNLFPQLFAPHNFVLGVVKYFLVWFTRENAFCKCAQSRSVSFL